MKKAPELDPLSPIFDTLLAQTYYFARQYQQSLAQYNKTLQLNPDFFVAHAQLVWLYAQLDDYPNAIAEMMKTRLLTGSAAQKVAADELELKRAFASHGREGFGGRIRAIQGIAGSLDSLRSDPRFAVLLQRMGFGP